MKRRKAEGGRRKLTKPFFFILQPSALIFSFLLSTARSVTSATVPLAPTPIPGALYVNVANPIGPISPYVFGTHYGPWVFLMPAVKPKAIEAGFKYLRYPGGEYGDSVDLMEYQIDEALTLYVIQ